MSLQCTFSKAINGQYTKDFLFFTLKHAKVHQRWIQIKNTELENEHNRFHLNSSQPTTLSNAECERRPGSSYPFFLKAPLTNQLPLLHLALLTKCHLLKIYSKKLLAEVWSSLKTSICKCDVNSTCLSWLNGPVSSKEQICTGGGSARPDVTDVSLCVCSIISHWLPTNTNNWRKATIYEILMCVSGSVT